VSADPELRAGLTARMLRVRAMTQLDVPAVGALERAAYPFPWTDGIFRDCLRVGYLCRVAEVERDLAGYGILAMGADEAHLLNLCVRADLRGFGIGRRMLQLLTEHARQSGAEAVFLEVRPSNPVAIALYQSAGFVAVGRRKGYYQAQGGREDALVLKLELSPDRGGQPA
jgi:ribosomal-protein-alanine N-acetyltransferase